MRAAGRKAFAAHVAEIPPFTIFLRANGIGSARKCTADTVLPRLMLWRHTVQTAVAVGHVPIERRVLGRKGLEAAACQCYSLIRAQFERFAG